MAPGPRRRIARAAAGGNVPEQRRDVLRRADVADRHPQELLARVAVVADRGVVDREEGERLGVVDPHRRRTRLEEHLRVPARAVALDRRRGAARELADHLEIGARVVAIGGEQRDRPEHLRPGAHRHAQPRAQPERRASHRAGPRSRARRRTVWSSVISRISSGSPVRMTIAGAARRVRRQRREVLGQRHPSLERSVVVRQVDRAPGGEARDEQLADALQRVLARQTRPAGATPRAPAASVAPSHRVLALPVRSPGLRPGSVRPSRLHRGRCSELRVQREAIGDRATPAPPARS